MALGHGAWLSRCASWCGRAWTGATALAAVPNSTARRPARHLTRPQRHAATSKHEVTFGLGFAVQPSAPKHLPRPLAPLASPLSRDPTSDVLRVRLYDEDMGKSDDDLGLAMMGLADLQGMGGGSRTFTLPLRGGCLGRGVGCSARLMTRHGRLPTAPDQTVCCAVPCPTAPAQAPARARAPRWSCLCGCCRSRTPTPPRWRRW